MAFMAYMLTPAILNAQDNGIQKKNFLQQMQTEEAKISKFINDKMKLPFPQEVLDEAFHTGHDHYHIEIPPSEKPLMERTFKRKYYRQLYFKENKDAVKKYNPGVTNISNKTSNKTSGPQTLICTDGDFEDGVADLATYLGYGGDSAYVSQTGVCNFIPTTTSTLPFVAFGNTDFFSITNNVADPLIPSINQTNNNSAHAVRINAPTPCPHPWGDVNMLQKTFTTTTSGIQSVSFSYALVMEDPSHGLQNPFFVARILDGAGVEQDRICRVSDASNTAFYTVTPAGLGGSCNYTTIVSRDWTCESLTFNGSPNQTYTIEFFVADCALGGHFSYAYVDDICVNCTPDSCNSPGSLVLQPTDTCQKTMTVCASYTPPMVNCVTGVIDATSPTLTVLQGGLPTGVVLTNGVVNTTAQTICFNVTPADFGALTGGFDFRIEADFTLGTSTVTLDDTHTNPSQDNDYTTNPCVPACECGSWSKYVYMWEQNPWSYIGKTTCGKSIATPFTAGKTYRFRYKYNCKPSATCKPTYTVTSTLNGTVSTVTTASGYLYVSFTPNAKDCGPNSITVYPYCDGKPCPPCTIYFNVDGCHECVEPFKESIYCGPKTGKPVVEFCLRNLTNVPRSYFGITMPPGVSYSNLTLPADATIVTTTANGMIVFQTATPVAPNGLACTFKFLINGGIYQGQELCLDLKSFTYYNAQGQFLNCCVDPVPLCFTIPDCKDDCADILNPLIYCNNQGQRILRYRLRNNYYFQLDAYESFTVNGTPADYFFGFFSPPVMNGNISPWITHVIPASIPGGSQYCFTNTVHMYYDNNGHPCDSICYTDTVCLTVPICKTISTQVSVGKGGNKNSTDDNEIQSIDSIVEKYLIYPNPVDEIIHIKSQSVDDRISSVVLMDITGKILVREKQNNLILHRLDISSYPKGVYLLRVNDSKIFKVMKK